MSFDVLTNLQNDTDATLALSDESGSMAANLAELRAGLERGGLVSDGMLLKLRRGDEGRARCYGVVEKVLAMYQHYRFDPVWLPLLGVDGRAAQYNFFDRLFYETCRVPAVCGAAVELAGGEGCAGLARLAVCDAEDAGGLRAAVEAARAELVLLAAAPETAPPAAPTAAKDSHERRRHATWQEAAGKLLVYAHEHPRAHETQKILCRLAGGCSRNTLRKALGLDRERCPVTEALNRWYTTPGHKAPEKFFVHTAADLPEGMFEDMAGTIQDATAFVPDDEVEIYYRKIVALVADPVQRKSMEQADFASRRALVATAMASEKYADALT